MQAQNDASATPRLHTHALTHVSMLRDFILIYIYTFIHTYFILVGYVTKTIIRVPVVLRLKL